MKHTLTQGRRYRVTTQQGTFEANYLGWSNYAGTHGFDRRPEFGTQEVPDEDIQGEPVDIGPAVH